MHRRLTTALACTLFLHGGCGNGAERSADGVKIEQAAVPARYDSSLPDSVAGMQSWINGDARRAPVAHVADQILLGSEKWLQRLREAGSKVAAAEGPAWARQWLELFKYREVSNSFCREARAMMSAPASPVRAAISGPFAQSCVSGSSDGALILRDDTPAWSVLAYFDPIWGIDGTERGKAFHPRLAIAAQEIIAASRHDARRAAFILASLGNPDAEAALLTIHSRIKDQPLADEVALAFLTTNNTAGLELAKGACSRRPRDPMCSSDRAARNVDIDDAPVEEEKVALEAIKARVAQLREMGFGKVANLDAATLDSDSAEQILVEAGHAHWFDVETGMYPNHHDSLLRQLAALAAPELDLAIFEESLPANDEASDPYGLVAYVSGKRYSTRAENLGDWYDLDAVLRLLNTIMADRNAAARFQVIGTDGQTVIVVAAPPAVVAAATKAGLLKVEDPAAAAQAGKEFDQQVIEALQKERQ